MPQTHPESSQKPLLHRLISFLFWIAGICWSVPITEWCVKRCVISDQDPRFDVYLAIGLVSAVPLLSACAIRAGARFSTISSVPHQLDLTRRIPNGPNKTAPLWAYLLTVAPLVFTITFMFVQPENFLGWLQFELRMWAGVIVITSLDHSFRGHKALREWQQRKLREESQQRELIRVDEERKQRELELAEMRKLACERGIAFNKMRQKLIMANANLNRYLDESEYSPETIFEALDSWEKQIEADPGSWVSVLSEYAFHFERMAFQAAFRRAKIRYEQMVGIVEEHLPEKQFSSMMQAIQKSQEQGASLKDLNEQLQDVQNFLDGLLDNCELDWRTGREEMKADQYLEAFDNQYGR